LKKFNYKEEKGDKKGGHGRKTGDQEITDRE
jgi:hypothetical protein